MFDIGNTVGFFRSIALASAMIGAGCQVETQRPDFLTRSSEDCALGDLSACSMLDALRVQSALVKPTALANRNGHNMSIIPILLWTVYAKHGRRDPASS
jgi:hypothetical protein